MRRKLRFVYLHAVTAALAFSNTAVVQVSVTPTQAVAHVQTDQPGNCTYRISESPSLSPVINDVNTALFAGSNSDARTGSVVRDTDHWFVAGARTTAQGSDGAWYSRALAANTAHYGGVTCGADAEVAFNFTTNNIPLGNTYMDPVPYNSAALGNYAVPSFDFTNLAKQYIDPQTGFKYQLLTGPGQSPESAPVLTGGFTVQWWGQSGNVPGEASGTNWTTPSNGLLVDGAFATYTASAQDVLTLRLASLCWQNYCTGLSWSNVGQMLSTPIDAYQLALTGNGGGSTMQVDVALSWNGVSRGSEWETITLPASTGTVTYPASLAVGFAGWQSANYTTVPATYWQVMQQNFTVNTSGTGVTQTGGAPFPLDPRVLTAGSKITIGTTEYTIASVDSATHLTLATSAGTQTGVAAYIGNFSVLVRKHSASAGTLNVDGAAVKIALSDTWGNGKSGFQNFCSHVTGTDAGGNVGRFCIFQVDSGNSGVFWVYTTPSGTLGSRFISRAYAPASSIGVPADEYRASFYNGQSLFDTTDPNSWWLSATLNSTGRTTLVKATYKPAGVGGCTVTANYQPMIPNSSYDALDNCNITYMELTRPSLGKDIWSQLPAALTSGKFGTVGPGLSFVQNGYAVMTIGNQDTEAWIVTVNLSTGNVNGIYSTYMNQAEASCRACVLHGVGPSSPTDDYFYLIFNNYFGGATTGGGPYNLTVNTALTATPSNPSCTGVTDPKVSWLIPFSSGCDNITLAGSDSIPCDPNPSVWETANMPACSWGSGTQWQGGAIKPGDWVQDPATGYELMVFATNVSGSTWTVLRNVDPPQGPTMIPDPYTTSAYLKAHSSNWTATLWCSYHQNAFASVSTETDGSGLIWDRKFFGFNHSALRAGGIISAEFFHDTNQPGLSVRQGSYPGAANTSETARVLSSAPFAGKSGLSNYLQSHLGWDGNATSFTDMSPLAPGSGGNFTLWPQPGVTNVTGTLYKIPAASAYIAMDKRRRAEAVWSGMYNFLDISGTGAITGTSSDYYHYCSIDYAGATCGQPGESVGDLFMNIPQATIDGNAGGTFDYNRPNAAPLSQEPLAVLQYFFTHLTAGSQENLGRWERRITTGGGRYNGQDTYSNAKVLFNSNILTFNCGAPNMQRTQDICMGVMPPDPPTSSVFRGDFYQYPVPIQAGSAYAEIQFGYAENGPPDQFYCTSRQEACNTSSPGSVPFNWEGEARVLNNCSQGCTTQAPVIPDRVVYYRARWSDDGQTWKNGPLNVAVVP